jgi:hypothetical protein
MARDTGFGAFLQKLKTPALPARFLRWSCPVLRRGLAPTRSVAHMSRQFDFLNARFRDSARGMQQKGLSRFHNSALMQIYDVE